MLAAPFTSGVGLLCVLCHRSRTCSSSTATRRAYGVAGLAAALIAGAQIVGGLLVSSVRRLFSRRTHALIARRHRQRRPPRPHRTGQQLRRRARPVCGLGADLRVRGPAPPGVHQRAHPVGSAGHGALVRLADGLGRRRGRPAGARSDGGPLRLPGVVRRFVPPSRPLQSRSRSSPAARTPPPIRSRTALALSPCRRSRPPSRRGSSPARAEAGTAAGRRGCWRTAARPGGGRSRALRA